MLPTFNDDGFLDPGIHCCGIDELVARFGSGSTGTRGRDARIDWFHRVGTSGGVSRLIVNGSYVTEATAPQDVDLVILPGPDYPKDQQPVTEQELSWPFLHILVAADEHDLEVWAAKTSGLTAAGIPKESWRFNYDPGVNRCWLLANQSQAIRLLIQRRSRVSDRTDLNPAHCAEVLRSYDRMIGQYRAEIKLHEAAHAPASTPTAEAAQKEAEVRAAPR